MSNRGKQLKRKKMKKVWSTTDAIYNFREMVKMVDVVLEVVGNDTISNHDLFHLQADIVDLYHFITSVYLFETPVEDEYDRVVNQTAMAIANSILNEARTLAERLQETAMYQSETYKSGDVSNWNKQLKKKGYSATESINSLREKVKMVDLGLEALGNKKLSSDDLFLLEENICVIYRYITVKYLSRVSISCVPDEYDRVVNQVAISLAESFQDNVRRESSGNC